MPEPLAASPRAIAFRDSNRPTDIRFRSRFRIVTNEIHSRVRVLAASVLFTVSLTLLPLASASAAQATWSPETVLSAPNVNGATQIRVANNAGGVSAVVRDERVDYYTTHLYVSVNDGSGWTAAKRLTTSPTLYSSTAGAVVAPDPGIGAAFSYRVERAGFGNGDACRRQ